MSSSDIQQDTIIGISSRAFDIMSNVIFNRELYSTCNVQKRVTEISIPMYIYKPDKPYPGTALDFDHQALLSIFKMGYNLKEPNITKYCY